MMKVNKEATRCQQGQAERLVGSKSLTINKGQGCPKIKIQGGIIL